MGTDTLQLFSLVIRVDDTMTFSLSCISVVIIINTLFITCYSLQGQLPQVSINVHGTEVPRLSDGKQLKNKKDCEQPLAETWVSGM